MKKLTLLAVPVSLLIGAAAFAVPAETVEARKAYFKSIGGVMKPMSGLAKSFDAEAAKAEADKLRAVLATDIATLFVPGTSDADLPGQTRAMAVIWEKPEDFAAKSTAMTTAGASLIAAADAGDAAAFATAFGQMGGTCKACHDSYRLPE